MPSIFSKRGFTIIELAIVAAIIGVLATIGTTAYWKFSARARQRVAKVYLSTAYLAERTFFAEHLSYTYCLKKIKGLPGEPGAGPGTDNRPYFIGFSNGSGALLCGPASNQSCFAVRFSPTVVTCNCGAFPAGGSNDCGADATSPTTGAATGVYTWRVTSRSTFTVGAAGFLNRAVLDVWTIDDQKLMVQINNGE